MRVVEPIFHRNGISGVIGICVVLGCTGVPKDVTTTKIEMQSLFKYYHGYFVKLFSMFDTKF